MVREETSCPLPEYSWVEPVSLAPLLTPSSLGGRQPVSLSDQKSPKICSTLDAGQGVRESGGGTSGCKDLGLETDLLCDQGRK